MQETGRYRELSCWRKDFKKTWRALEKKPIAMPLNVAYRPNIEKWVCSCPSFAISRFLVCKHLIQHMHRVPAIFFLEVRRHRTTPFWRHTTLKPLPNNAEHAPASETTKTVGSPNDIDDDMDDEGEGEGEGDDDDEGDEDDAQITHDYDGHTFEEIMNDDINLIFKFAKGLQYQVQFRDQRMLSGLKREGAGFFRFARACLEKERVMNSTRGRNVSTWDKSTSSAMFYRAMPTAGDEGT